MINIDKLLSFDQIYQQFIEFFADHECALPWECETLEIENIFKLQSGINDKVKHFTAILNKGKKFKDTEDDFAFNRDLIIKLMAGGAADLKSLFHKEYYNDLGSVSLNSNEETLEMIFSSIESDDADLLRIIQKLLDWATLVDILNNYKTISEAKVKLYERHKEDLKLLKAIVKKYIPEKYKEVFNSTSEKLKNYAAYSYHYKTIPTSKVDPPKNKASKEEFYKYLKNVLKEISPQGDDILIYDDIIDRIGKNIFLPKQIDTDNRIIPHQLYLYELQLILENASKYLPWLNKQDQDGITPREKITSIFSFRIPYYVGPLRRDNNPFAWIERKAGHIYPWNFDKMVDFDACEEAFIKEMTNTCTYLPDEKVLPKNSLLYCKFAVLNEINTIKINGEPISVNQKQDIFNNCILKHQKVTKKSLENYCISNGFMKTGDVLEGVDIQLTSSMKPYFDFRSLLQRKLLTEDQVEKIITHSTYTEDTTRFYNWLVKAFPYLDESDIRYISKKRYKDFGRLSEAFLNKLVGHKNDGCESGTILYFLWNTNYNLNQLLSKDFSFYSEIELIRNEYYAHNSKSIQQRLDEMYISNSVKRPIIRTLEIVKEVVHAQGCAPERIFIEMARGDGEKVRTKSRKQQLLDMYSKADEDTSELENMLNKMGDMADTELQSDALYLYYLQLGKCMYTGEPIELSKLRSGVYNIDHIYPQQFVKDDSVLNNKVLVKSESNGEKNNNYPIDPKVQGKMQSFWEKLHKNMLITDEKYKRLIRKTTFTDDEKYAFINRQLVETRQSTKAVATLLNELYPDTEIVYVKAGNVADFRHEYGLVKCRCVNDLHHAKDAYLNIVVGNVYHFKFSKEFWKKDNYNLKTEKIFGYPIYYKDQLIWDCQNSLSLVKKIYSKNNVHLTKYSFCRKGGFFNQNPSKASGGLYPRKKELDPEKYGGYNDKTATFFIPVRFCHKGKQYKIIIMPVDLVISKQFLSDLDFALKYAHENLKSIIDEKKNENITDISFPLGMRIIKINTVFSLDGFRVCLSGKQNKGKVLGFVSKTSLVLDSNLYVYIKKLESFENKRKNKANVKLSEKHDGITREKNLELYLAYAEKAENTLFKKLPGIDSSLLNSRVETFEKLSIEEQISCLMQIASIYKTNRSSSCDLSYIGGSKNAGNITLNSNIANWTKNYKDVRIIDSSTTGIYESVSSNLLEML